MTASGTAAQRRLLREHIRNLALSYTIRTQSVCVNVSKSPTQTGTGGFPTFITPLAAQND